MSYPSGNVRSLRMSMLWNAPARRLPDLQSAALLLVIVWSTGCTESGTEPRPRIVAAPAMRADPDAVARRLYRGRSNLPRQSFQRPRDVGGTPSFPRYKARVWSPLSPPCQSRLVTVKPRSAAYRLRALVRRNRLRATWARAAGDGPA